MTTTFNPYRPKRPAGEIVNPHVFPNVPDPHRAAFIQLMDWCAVEMKRRNRSEWNRTSEKTPTEEWSHVLGWDIKRGYSICYWYTHSNGKVLWSVNNVSGTDEVKPPSHWRELPAEPGNE